MTSTGYLDSPWPGEDAGPQRLQTPHAVQALNPAPSLNLRPGEHLACTTRNTLFSTMTVLGAPGEVYLLTHSALRARLGFPTTACVERIDPITLAPLAQSPRLAGGPMWPGGMAIHRNGDIVVVYGRHAHRLDRACVPLARFQLPVNEPYNSFVILDNGLVVTKNLSRRTPARLTVLDPQTLEPVGQDTVCAEPSVARLSALGNCVYVVGLRSILRYHWDARQQRLVRDDGWSWDYIGSSSQTHGWDVVLDGENAWFMDNGHHRYVHRMVAAGVSRTANRLLRVSLSDAQDHDAIDVCGLVGGSITNPPLVDVKRGIVIGYDSANRHLQAWSLRAHSAQRRRAELTPRWQRRPFGCASHMILYPGSGELVINDYRHHGEEVVVLDIDTGQERGRVRSGGVMQGVVFPSVGFGRDFYWSSMGRLARVYVQ